MIAHLRNLAKKHPEMSFSELADAAQSGGHFDKVIVQIDQMIADLRKEEQDDIVHRDRCQKQQGKNANDMADLSSQIDKAKESLSRMASKESDLQAQIETLIAGIKETEGEMQTLLELRNKAVKEFRTALDEDTKAVDLLGKALAALTAYFKKNTLLQRSKEEPEVEYTVDKDKMPEPGFSGADSSKGASTPIISMIEAIKVDIENEMKTSQEDDAKAQADYEKQRGAMRDSVKADTETKVATESELADLQAAMTDKTNFKERRQADLSSQKDLEGTLDADCSWVATHFQSRRDKRKTEIQGLEEAKNYLAGSEDPLE